MGSRSYEDIALGLALLLVAVAIVRVAVLPRLAGVLAALTGVAYIVQGWTVGSEGFSPNESTAIIAGWVLAAVWMIWLVIVAIRQDPRSSPG